MSELTAEDIQALMTRISPKDWNYCYAEWECNLLKDEYEINAGGWMRISKSEEAYLFGCKSEYSVGSFFYLNPCVIRWEIA
jgi:hypothetical protein